MRRLPPFVVAPVSFAIVLAGCSSRPTYTERTCAAVTTLFSRAQSGGLVSGSFMPEARSLIQTIVATGPQSNYPEIRAASFEGVRLFSADAHPEEVMRALEPLRGVCARVGS